MPPLSRRAAGALLLSPLFVPLLAGSAMAAPRPSSPKLSPKASAKGPLGNSGFVAAWEGAAQGPYPVGNPAAQPDLRFAFPDATEGAREQSFRLVLRPDVWGRQARLRLTNAFGTHPVTFADIYVGLQQSGATLVPGTNRGVKFAGKRVLHLAPGQSAVSDPVGLPFVGGITPRFLAGRRLAVSFHVVGTSGPMTWHAKAMTTSYLSLSGAGSHSGDETETAFPSSTTSWFFLDLVEMGVGPDLGTVVCLGDSLTDGTASTLNGDDRWPDQLSRRLKAAGNAIAVVNAGIGGNRVVGPAEYTTAEPFAGGPSALARLERDVISLPGVTHVVWLEGINDLGKSGGWLAATPVIAGFREGVARLRAAIPGVKIIGATLPSVLGSTNPGHGTSNQDAERHKLNDFIRSGDLFDHVADFDRTTLDPQTGGLRPEFVPDSATGGPGDKVHPNRAGYLAMAQTLDVAWFTRHR